MRGVSQYDAWLASLGPGDWTFSGELDVSTNLHANQPGVWDQAGIVTGWPGGS